MEHRLSKEAARGDHCCLSQKEPTEEFSVVRGTTCSTKPKFPFTIMVTEFKTSNEKFSGSFGGKDEANQGLT